METPRYLGQLLGRLVTALKWLYLGEFVVPYCREIIAHGTDAAAVLAEAARITGRRVEELPLVGVIDPLLDVPHD
jgi:hypothetical protein